MWLDHLIKINGFKLDEKNAKEITTNKCNLICGCSAITLKEGLENVRLVEEIQGDACLILPSWKI